MPRYSRFLFGGWCTAGNKVKVASEKELTTVSAKYTDFWGGRHYRKIEMYKDYVKCIDIIDGFSNNAILRWHVPIGDWVINNDGFSSGIMSIAINSDVENDKSIQKSVESRYYLLKEPVTVLQTMIKKPSRIISKIYF